MSGRAIRGAFLAALVVVALLAASARGQAAPETKRIVLIYSYNPNAPGVVAFAHQLRAVVGERYPTAELYEEHLAVDRLPHAAQAPQLARYYAEKYRGLRPDAILVAGTPALRFAVEQLDDVFPGVPVVYGGAFEPTIDYARLPAHVVGRRQLLPFASTYRLARALQPDARRVVVVGGSSPADSLLVAEARRQITPLLDGVPLHVYQDWTYESLVDSLRRFAPRTIVLLSDFSWDRLGVRRFIPGDLVATLARVASVPTYGIARNWVGDGIVGGGVMDFGDDGARTGALLLRVLGRRRGDPMPPSEVAANRLVVDWRQLQRWSLRADRLPANTEVLFRPPSTWQRYRGAILGALALLLLETLLIARLLVERARRLRAQRAVEEQVRYERMLRALTADVARRSALDARAALEDALPDVARFAGASAAVLVVDAGGEATRLTWAGADDAVRRSDGRGSAPAADGTERLEIPLIVEERRYGALELHRPPGDAWPADMVARLRPVGDLLAGALARAGTARALEQTRGQVEHMGRVATLNGLASAVAHELRQPLTAIGMNAEAAAAFLARTPPDVEEARAALREIGRDDARAAAVVEHYRALLRREPPASTSVDVNALCRSTAMLVAPEAAARLARVTLDLDPAVPSVRGDPLQLQQALINLALNALEALPASASAREVGIRTVATRDAVEIHVTDTGPGLSAEALQRLFEPFFSTKPHGLGMGVTIVRSIVERHHGTLRVENRAEGGALFTVTLPAADGAQRPARA